MKRNGIAGGAVTVGSGGVGGIEATSAKKSSMAGSVDYRAAAFELALIRCMPSHTASD